MNEFDWTRVVPLPMLEALTDMRVHDPERIPRAARQRRRRPFVTLSGRLNLVSMEPREAAVVRRGELLGRLVAAMSSDWCDGIVAPVALLEDLILLHDASVEHGAPGCLEHKLLIADCIRAGGSWLGGNPAACEEYRLDGFHARFASGETVSSAGADLESLARLGVRTIVEVPVATGELARPALAALTPSLGMTRYMWLALPISSDLADAFACTPLPALLRADSRADAAQTLKRIDAALPLAANARGALCGPAVWRSPGLDPRKVVSIAGRMIHEKVALAAAVEAAQNDAQPAAA